MQETDLKTRLERIGKSQADLCRAMEVDYTRLNGHVNGLWKLSQEQTAKIAAIVDLWEREEAEKRRAGGPV